MRFKIFLVGSVASLAALLAVVGLSTIGGSPDQAHGQVPPTTPNYRCFNFGPGVPPPVPPVNLQTQFGPENNVVVGPGMLLCADAGKNGPPSGVPPLRCHQIAGASIAQSRDITTQYERELAVQITTPQLLCVPASQVVFPPGAGGLPPVPPGTYYKCYTALGKNPSDVVGTVATKFGVENNLAIGQGVLYCPPALKNGVGSLVPPPLRCFDAVSGAPPFGVVVGTQFYPPPIGEPPGPTPLGSGALFCVPAKKTTASIGGIAELPDERDVAPLTADESSGLGVGAIAAIAAGGLVAVVAFGGTAFFVRRRVER